jgi:hypothetical protein
MQRLKERLIWLTVYAVAMAYLESAVVVYLRAIYYPAGFGFPLALIEPGMSAIEIGREAATLVMLLGVAMVMSEDRWERFLFFCLSFGVWDTFYYVWLWVFLDWPPSLLTWDILFLIPIPWIGPVLAPLIISVALIIGSLLLLRLRHRGIQLRFPTWSWVLAVSGGGIVLSSFMLDFRTVLAQVEPPPFRWWLFALGVMCGITALTCGVSRLPNTTTSERP